MILITLNYNLNNINMRKRQDDEIPDEAFKLADMTEDMKNHAYRTAMRSLQKFSIEKDIAQYVKEEFDRAVEFLIF